jgi:hypothetical protein
MDGERGDDEVVAPFGKRVLQPLDPQICGREAFPGYGEHRLVLIDPDEPGRGMHRQHRRGCLPGSHAELENRAGIDAAGRFPHVVL